jgi:hypothetical protein
MATAIVFLCIQTDILGKLVHDLPFSIMALNRRYSALSLTHGVEDW